MLFEHHDIVVNDGGRFDLRFAGDLRHGDVFLTIDIYDFDNPVHPEGHIGWWRFSVDALGQRSSGYIRLKDNGFDVSVADQASEDYWINESLIHPRRSIVNAVLRTKSANAIVSLDHIPAFATEQDLSGFRSKFNRDWRIPRFSACHYVPPPGRTVRIVSQNVNLYDAVGHLCLNLYRMLRQNNVAVEIYAEQFNLEINDIVRPMRRLFEESSKTDYVLYFFSIYDKYLKQVLDLIAARKITYFHGITPPSLLQAFDPELSVACSKALKQLPELARFDIVAANSFATARDLIQSFAEGDRQLERVKIIAPCLTWKRAYPQPNRPVGSTHARFLYVGQIRPHKRIECLLELFAAYQKLSPDAECWIVGSKAATAYGAYLSWVERTHLCIPPARVHWLGNISEEALQNIYRSASIYISMSEHEGFCLPVLEAMVAGLPVLSYAQAAIQELLGSSGIVFFDRDFSELANYIRALLDSPDRLAEIIARQYDRATTIMHDTDGTAFWHLLTPEPRPSRTGVKYDSASA